MVDYKQLYNSLDTVSDFISLCENYDEAEIEKNTITWDYDTSAYTYLGNVGNNFTYLIPPTEFRAGTQAAMMSPERGRLETHNYTHGYDRHYPDDFCQKVIDFLGFKDEYQADVNVQPPNTVKVLHYDNMRTFCRNFESLHSLSFDTINRQPKHRLKLRRLFVALSDWEDGWMFQMGKKQWSGWKKGDVIDFHWRGQPHSTANASFSHRPILKISGFTDISFFGNAEVQ